MGFSYLPIMNWSWWLGSWWRNPVAGGDGSCSNSYTPDGIEKITEAVYKLCEPTGPLEVEIVFIHGLQLFNYKDAYWKTWIGGEKGKEICWPITWLGEDLPGARIWSLSYDACALRTGRTIMKVSFLVAESLVQNMVDVADIGQENRPVVFVCHSLGGVVVKEIVINAHLKFGNDPKYKSFFRNIKGFHFYATPHYGSKLADLYAELPEMGGLVDQLRVINSRFGRLNDEFERIQKENYANTWKFSVVAETLDTKTPYGFSAMVVEEASARHVYNKFLPVAADHFGVCKPESKESSGYEAVRNFIEEVVEDHRLRSGHLLELPNLVGMEDRMQELREKLKVHSAVGLVGMGGIGKTTLSKHFYNFEKWNYERSCFLEGVKSGDLHASHKQLFRDLCGEEWRDDNVNEQLQKIRRCILTMKVLLVVDDVSNEKGVDALKALRVDAFKDGKEGSKVIVTTRRRDVLFGFVSEEGIIGVEELNGDQALELFSYYAFGNCDVEGDCSVRVQFDAQAKEIAEACGGLPLSLEVMGQYLRRYNHASYDDVRTGMWATALVGLREAKSLNGTADDRLWTTLRTSYDDLDKVHQSIFLDLACLNCEIKRLEESGDVGPYCLDRQMLARIWGDPIRVQNLIDFSLIKWNGDKKSLVMHDQLRDLGRSIVKDLANGNNGELSRIWEDKHRYEGLLS